jgi:integrase
MLRLTWKDINLLRRVAQVVTSENGDARTVPLSLRAVAILTALPRTVDGPVFPLSS